MSNNNKSWRCFHCDEVFYNPNAAQEHFGKELSSIPACKLSLTEGHLVTYIRKLEEELRLYREEHHPLDNAWFAKDIEHREALRKAEEEGFNKGVQEATRLYKEGKIV